MNKPGRPRKSNYEGPAQPIPLPEPVWFRLVCLGLTVALGVALAWFPVDDDDIWWHLASGRYILQNGIPRAEPFSYMSAGRPWIAEYWLYQVPLFLLWQAGGEPAFVMAKAMVVACFLAGAYWLSRKAKLQASTFSLAMLPVLLAMCARFTGRPEMLDWLYLLAFAALLPRGTELLSNKAIAVIALVQVLFNNTHSAFLLGPVVCGLAAAGQAINLYSRTDSPADGKAFLRQYVLLCGALIVAILLNPYGWRILSVPFAQFRSSIFVSRGAEFEPFWKAPQLLARLAPVPLLLLLGFALVRSRTRDAVHWLWAGAFLLLGLSGLRHIPLLAAMSVPIVFECMGQNRYSIFSPPRAVQTKAILALLCPLLLIAIVTTGWLWHWTGVSRRPGLFSPEWRFLKNELDYLSANMPPGRGLHPYEHGGYLAWRLYPSKQNALDNRNIVHGQAAVARLFNLGRTGRGWKEFVQEFGVDWAVLTAREKPLLQNLVAAGWRVIYVGNQAAVLYTANRGNASRPPAMGTLDEMLEKAVAEGDLPRSVGLLSAPGPITPLLLKANLVSALGAPLKAVELLSADAIHLQSRELKMSLAVHFAEAGLQSASRQAWPAAEKHLKAALRLNPGLFESWNNLAYVYMQSGRSSEAITAWNEALRLRPGDMHVQANLARAAQALRK